MPISTNSKTHLTNKGTIAPKMMPGYHLNDTARNMSTGSGLLTGPVRGAMPFTVRNTVTARAFFSHQSTAGDVDYRLCRARTDAIGYGEELASHKSTLTNKGYRELLFFEGNQTLSPGQYWILVDAEIANLTRFTLTDNTPDVLMLMGNVVNNLAVPTVFDVALPGSGRDFTAYPSDLAFTAPRGSAYHVGLLLV